MLRAEGILSELNENTSYFEKNETAEYKSKGGSVDAAFGYVETVV